MVTRAECSCGAIELEIAGNALLQYYCHCDDCQTVHGKAYPCSLYPEASVSVLRGETEIFTLRTTPRIRCKQCGTYLFGEVASLGMRGVNGEVLPQGMFNPAFHIQCRYAAAPIRDGLPHYKGLPARFRGSDEQMEC
jgi:hypothetical protein